MGVYIKNMEIPKNCAECDLSIRRHSSMGDIIDCKRIGTVGSAFNDPHMILINRHPNCPLVEILPHGRLIDVNEIEIPCLETTADQKWMEIAIKSTPTVIEAEGNE